MKKFLLLVMVTIGLMLTGNVIAQINSNSPAVPFGSRTSYPYGIMPANLPTSGTYGKSQDAADWYNTWKSSFVENCSNGKGTRIKFDNTSETVSEGIAYGMLLSVYAADKPLFDNLWKYYRNFLNGNGVMHWKINGCDGVNQQNGATDAELDAAMALIIASEQWPSATSPYNYKNEANYLLGKIKQWEIHPSTNQTLNGDMWGNTNDCRNPSYFAPAYYKEFAIFDAANASFWNSCVSACNSILTTNRNSTTGLVSNWCGSNGSPNTCGNTGGGADGYGSDASRNPWRMATDMIWHGTGAASISSDICGKISNWITGYENQLKGPLAQNASNPSVGSYPNGTYTTFALPSMGYSAKQSSLNSCYTYIRSIPNDNVYFNQTIRCVTMFVLTGNFWKPGSSGQIVAPEVLSATTNGAGTQIFVTFTKAMSTVSSSEYSNFTLKINGTTASGRITGIAMNGTNGITLTLSSAPVPGDVLTLSYTPGSIKSTDNGVLAAFSNKTVENALAGNNTILDDCEDGDSVNKLGGKWFSYTDVKDKGASTVTPMSKPNGFTMTAPGYNSSSYAAKVSFTLNKGGFQYDPYIGMGTAVDADTLKNADWTGSTGISFWYKGSATSLNVITPNVKDYGFHYFAIPASTGWTKMSFKWADIVQPTWATKVTFDIKVINKIQWQASGATGTTGEIWVDDVQIDGLVPKCTPPTITINASATSVCSGTSVTLTASGGSTYSWSNGQTTAAITVSPTSTSTYTVTGTAATGGCSSTKSQAITVNAAPSITITSNPSNGSICPGGTVTLSATGATSYSWSTGGVSSSITANPTATTTYTVTGTSNGCTGTSSKVITLNTPPVLSLTANPTTVCGGGSSTLTASGATTYQFSGGTGNGATRTVTPTGTTIYSVTGTDDNGCTNTATTTVNYSTAPDITITPSSTSACNGSSVTLTGGGATSYSWSTSETGEVITVSPTTLTTYTVTGTSGTCSGTSTVTISVNPRPTISVTPNTATVCSGGSTSLTASGGSNYIWSSGGTNAIEVVSPTTSTTYTVTGTNAAGCSNTATATITVGSSATIEVTASSTAICPGESTTLTASGGSSYNWGGGITSAVRTVSPASSTTYTVTGTNISGCTGVASINIDVNTAPTVEISPATASVCSGSSTTLTASGAVDYAWSNGLGSGVSKTVTPTALTTYTVTGTDNNGCTSTATSTVSISSGLTITASASQTTVCEGEKVTLSAVGADNYQWSNSSSGSSIDVTPSATTTYTVTGSDLAGCRGTGSVSITVNPLPTVAISPSNPNVCAGISTTLTASGAVQYAWSNSGAGANQSVSPTTTTTYTVTGTNINGCENTTSSTVTVNQSPSITVNPSTSTVCAGTSTTLTASGASSYAWSSGGNAASEIVTPTISTTYTVTGTATNNCTATATATITVNSALAVSIVASKTTICEGETITLTASGANNYEWSNSTSGASQTVTPSDNITYTVTGSDGSGCDGTATVSITVNKKPVITATASPTSICRGASSTLTAAGAVAYSWDNALGSGATKVVNPTATTTYSVTGTATNGCAGAGSIEVAVNALPTIAITSVPTSVCAGNSATLTATGGDNYTWNGGATGASRSVTPTQTTSYIVTGTDVNGCVSTTTFSLTVNQNPTVTATASSNAVCEGDNVTLTASGATTYAWSNSNSDAIQTVSPTATTTYVVTGTGSNGCTATASRLVTVNVPTTSTLVISECDSYTLLAQTYTTSGTYTQTIPNKAGCDSVITLNLTILKSTSNSITERVCDSYDLNGTIYTTSGTHTQVIPNHAGCDSTITLNLTIDKSTTSTLNVVYGGDYTLNGQTYTSSGSYTQTLINKAGCDSTLNLNLTINNQDIDTTVTSCGPFTFNGTTYSVGGDYNIPMSGGSTIYLHLTVKNPTSSSITQTACGSYTVNGETFTTSGVKTQIIPNAVGCDSTITLNLTILKPTSSTITESACVSYTSPSGKIITASGVIKDTIPNTAGCDSVITINLTINSPSSSTVNEVACDSLVYNGVTYKTSGTHTVVIPNAAGCDSTITLNVTINKSTSSTINETTNSSYTLNTETYTETGVYKQIVPNSNGCDSVITLNLVVNKPSFKDIYQTACDSFDLNGTVFDESGTFTQVLKNVAGFDSTITLYLTINKFSESTITEDACKSFSLNGTNYNASGVYEQIRINHVGCDSVITLNLTINQPSSSTLTVTQSGSYDLNGTIYDRSGIYTQTIPNSVGCDSVITLNLTIGSASGSEFYYSACESYTWNSQTYDASGDYVQTFKNVSGQDSIVTLHLTVNEPSTSDLTIVECESYNFRGVNITTSGIYRDTILNSVGCDSIIVLNLTINKNSISSQIVTSVGPYTINSQTFSTSGTHTQVIPNAAGCDSTITIYLTIIDFTELLATINKAQNISDTAAIGTEPGQYPQSAKTTLDEAISDAQDIAISTTVTQSEVNIANNTLKNEIENFLAKINGAVDKSALIATINSAEAISLAAIVGTQDGNYPQSALDEFNAAINTAKDVRNNISATSLEVSNAKSTLETAIQTFLSKKIIVTTADKSLLEATINSALNISTTSQVGDRPGNYPSTAKYDLDEVITAAQLVMGSQTATQTEVNDMTIELNTAISDFLKTKVGQPDKTALLSLLNSGETISNTASVGDKPGSYPQTAKDVFDYVLSQVQAVAISIVSTQQEVNEAITTLQNAITTFQATKIGQPDKTALTASIDAANDVFDNSKIGTAPGEYSLQAYNDLNSAINAAEAVLVSTSVSQNEVNAAKTAIDNAKELFLSRANPNTNKTDLQSIIADAEAIIFDAVVGDRPTEYSTTSFNEFADAIAVANQILSNPSVNQITINSAVSNLENAIQYFVESANADANKETLLTYYTEAVALRDKESSNIGSKPSQYPVSAFELFELIIEQSKALIDDSRAKQVDINSQTLILSQHIDLFLKSVTPQPSKSNLSEEITDAKEAINNAKVPTEFMLASVEKLDAAITAAEAVLNNPQATESEVIVATAKIRNSLLEFENSRLSAVVSVDSGVLTVGPNPVDKNIIINSPKKISRVVIFNMLGVEVINLLGTGNVMEISSEDIPSGSYLLKVVYFNNEFDILNICK